MIIGMPGISGSLGECQVCGKSFVKEVMLGQEVCVGHVKGIKGDIAFHSECEKALVGSPRWEDLPDGPLRRCFEANHTS